MKRLAALALGSLIAGVAAATLAAPASAACTTFDEHNKAHFNNCSPNAGHMSGENQQTQDLPIYTYNPDTETWSFVHVDR